MSKEAFLTEQLRLQFHDFVSILCKEKAAKGNALDLQDAIESCRAILAYLNHAPSSIEVEDILIKLAIEAGDYCARGIKRTSAEIHSGLVTKDNDPQKTYELTIRSHLQNVRQQIMQNTYLKLMEIMVQLAKKGNFPRLAKQLILNRLQ